MKRDFLVNFRGDKTQLEVATASNICRSMYAQIETGDRTPSVPAAKRIAKTLGFNWTIFFEYKSHETCIMEGIDNENNSPCPKEYNQYSKGSEEGSEEIATSNSL